MYALKNLSHADFEDLCLDIAKAETGLRFTAFGDGPDAGIDGFHSRCNESVILQCKHYRNSNFSQLKRAAKEEVKKVVKLAPKRYIFFTSQPLTTTRLKELLDIFSPFINSSEDIWGTKDIERALSQHPKITRAHFKLWLTNTAVLERVLHSAQEAFSLATKKEILDEVRLYVRNPSFAGALEILEKEKVLIVSGPPGVGKNTLARMVTYRYLQEEWQFYAIKSLSDGYAKLNEDSPTIFFFDDFLGRIALDKQSLAQHENVFSMFVRRISKSKNMRFILTTRAHIFEEARQISECLATGQIQLTKYLLDVGTYTRRIKSRILFNHLEAATLSKEHYLALLEGDRLPKIIDHKNYNPRIIASVSNELKEEIAPKQFPETILSTLGKPAQIWNNVYRGLDLKSQSLLFPLYFGKNYGARIRELRAIYAPLHRKLSNYYNQAASPTDFEDALKSLETGFIKIAGQNVDFINPSLRDFLKSHLRQEELLGLLADVATSCNWAKNVWEQIKGVLDSKSNELMVFTERFKPLTEKFNTLPVYGIVDDENNYCMQLIDLTITERARLLFNWWICSKENVFFDKIIAVLDLKSGLNDSWDAAKLPDFYEEVDNYQTNKKVNCKPILSAITGKITEIINTDIAIDELTSTIESVKSKMPLELMPALRRAIATATDYELNEVADSISILNTENELLEHIIYLQDLSKLTGKSAEYALEAVYEKIDDLEEIDVPEEEIDTPESDDYQEEHFDDTQLKRMFLHLVQD